ncbi:OsmC family protein [Jeongeupia chitinilytica]|uniref:OsmC family peroxiredoxin n=1 Tax=Jeongeupia chitinilytica TaxID=1041641 RepID=A0ABQ3H5A6_9NEIS|nr:OsmC family protein [Jeongeupia chitinilytica]GHD65805.1 hypothetical protein GCM10007350_26860 [Jeongeupia chitinilytica]
MAHDIVNAHLSGEPFRTLLTDGRHDWFGDVGRESGGMDAGPDPHAQLLAALGTCTAITLKMYAARKGWPLDDVRVRLAYAPDHKDGDAKIDRQVEFVGALDADQRARLLEIANACPIHKLLTGPVAVATTLTESP